jgi:hypothetical protein
VNQPLFLLRPCEKIHSALPGIGRIGGAMSFFLLSLGFSKRCPASSYLGGLAKLLQRRCKLVDVVEGNAMLLGAKQPPAEQPG